MNDFIEHLDIFLNQYLPKDLNASPQTVYSYVLSFKLLIEFATKKLDIRPCKLQIEHLCAELILEFLGYLEDGRGNCARTRNARLAALKSFFRYLELRAPACLAQARQVHAIPSKRFKEALIDTLSQEEVQALLDAPDPDTFSGVRDRAMFHLAFSAGLRVSELIGLCVHDLRGTRLDTVHIMGKGRRERVLPLWKQTKSLLRQWLAIRPECVDKHLFLNARGEAMTRQGVNYRLALHVNAASKRQPSLLQKRISPHSLRHGCALHILQTTGDIRKASLWLGHSSIQTTEIYLRVDPSEKLDIAAAGFPVGIRKGSFKNAPDRLLSILNNVPKP